MTIRLNGEPHDLSGPTTVAALLERLGIDSRRVAVEHNFVVLKRDAYGSTVVREGDEVEIVNFVGGGEGEIANCELGIERLHADLVRLDGFSTSADNSQFRIHN